MLCADERSKKEFFTWQKKLMILKSRLTNIQQKEKIHMKTIRYKTIAVLSLMLLIAGLYCQPPLVQALESESLNSDVPSESSKDLKDTTPSDSLKVNVPAESPKALKDTTPSESLKATVPAESSQELKDTTPSESLNSDDKGSCPPAYIKLVSPRSAKVGDTISIQGWRFGDDEGSVVFPNGVNADVTLWRQQRIEVTVPEGAQTGNIAITTACGSNNKPGAGSYFKVMEKQTEK
jgi:hypothetical protein